MMRRSVFVPTHPSRHVESEEPEKVVPLKFCTGALRRPPRQWLYRTSPTFIRLNRPLADSLREWEEVRLILDLADFCPGHICLEICPDRYFITANHDGMNFTEEILLPNDVVDVLRREEHFKDGILELALTRKT